MKKTNTLTKVLAVTGTVLVWLPIVAPLVFAVVALATRGRFLLDYLMPAELFPVAFVGGALLVWAAWRARLRRRLIGWAFVLMPVLLIASQGLAVDRAGLGRDPDRRLGMGRSAGLAGWLHSGDDRAGRGRRLAGARSLSRR